VKYDKPHLTFDEQLAKIESRGLVVDDRRVAVATLRRVGYYRLSAYWYPFRVMAQGSSSRLDAVIEGVTLEHALALYAFDEKLRAVLMQGLEVLEVALRVQVAYRLGQVDPFGHLKPEVLDQSEINRPATSGLSETRYQAWLRHYHRRCTESRNEDYVRHFHEKYDGELPVWVATELLDFGSLVRLLQFLPQVARNRVSRNFGIGRSNDFVSWCRSLNVVRNHCAHHARLWNRVFPYPPAKVNANRVPEPIRHLQGVKKADESRVYYMAALLAGLIRETAPQSNWPRSFRTVVQKFPEVPLYTPQSSMGFPRDWEEFELWKRPPSEGKP